MNDVKEAALGLMPQINLTPLSQILKQNLNPETEKRGGKSFCQLIRT